ncbi:MBL fold metallo-hydrolase, partial [Escherichia coli]
SRKGPQEKRKHLRSPVGVDDGLASDSPVLKLGLVLEKILLTHGHIDHVGGAKALAKAANVPIIGPHIADKFWIDNLPKQSQNFGFPHCDAFEPDQYLQDGDIVKVGEQ